MRRDVDLSRAILRFVEEHAPPQGGLDRELAIEGYDRPTVLAHAELLIEEGLIAGHILRGQGSPLHLVITRLTSKGHDALETIRNDTAWAKAKKAAVEHAVPLTISTLVELAKAEVRTRFGFG